MAFSITHRASNGSGTDAATYTTGSVQVNAGDLLLVFVTNASTAGTADAVSAVTGTLGSTLTWFTAGSVLMNSSLRARTTVLWAVCPVSVAGTLTLAFGGVTQASAQWTVATVIGAENRAPIINVQTVQTASANPSISLSPAAAATSMVVAAVHDNDVTAPTAGTGYTTIGNGTAETSPSVIHTVEYDLTSPSSTVAFVKAGATNKAAIAVEIREAQTGPFYAAATAEAVATAVASVVATKPAGLASGETLVALCWANNGVSTWSSPGGSWVADDAAAAQGSAIFHLVAGGSEPSTYTFTRAGSTTGAAGVTLVRVVGASTTAPVDASKVGPTGSGTTIALTGLTTTGTLRLLLQLVTKAITGAASWTPPGTATERFDQTSTGSAVVAAGGDEVVGSGATGTRTWTQTGTGATRGGMVALVAPATQTISPSGRASTAAVGGPTVTPGAVTLSPSGRASTAAVGGPTVAPGAVTVSPSGRASTATIGAPTVALGAATLSPSGVASTAAVGSPAVAPGAVTLSPSGRASTAAVGSPTVTPGAVTLSPSGRASTAAVGGPTVDPGAVTVSPGGRASTAAVGSPSVAPGEVTISPAGRASTTVVGEPAVDPGAVEVAPGGVGSTATVGGPAVTPGAVTVSPAGVDPGSSVGDPLVEIEDGSKTVVATGVAHTSTIGAPTVTAGAVGVAPAGIDPTSAVGAPALSVGAVTISPDPIGPGSSVGTPAIATGAIVIAPTGLAPTAVVGTPALLPGAVTLGPSGIPSTATVGGTTVTDSTSWPQDCWPVDLRCIPDWDDVTDPGDPDADPPVAPTLLYPTEVRELAMALAGQTMRVLTGFRVGGCPLTVRPCRDDCAASTWRTYTIRGGSASVPWTPVQEGGEWLNVGCGCGESGCSCSRVSEVRLHGPASSITEVKIDGTVLSDSAYRLDPGGLLVRTDGEGWPLCQDLSAADTEPGTWSVTYTAGAVVDSLGAWAAGLLTKEYVKACTGNDCGLPSGVTQIVRNGVTMTLAPDLFPGNRTGIPVVDAYVARWNPGGLKSSSVVVSPDVATPRAVRS